MRADRGLERFNGPVLILMSGRDLTAQAFRELATAGRKPFLAFSAGVVVNVILGFVLSVYVFGSHWQSLTR